MAKKRVVVLYGGRADEHSISCISTAGVLGAMDTERFEPIPVGITKDGKWIAVEGCGWKMFARIAGKTITDQTARRLLAGQSVTLKGFTSKSGKKFDAAIRIDKERGTAFDFDR